MPCCCSAAAAAVDDDDGGDDVNFAYYVPARREGAISVAFVRQSVRPSLRPSVAYIANNSRTHRPSVPKFGRKVLHL